MAMETSGKPRQPALSPLVSTCQSLRQWDQVQATGKSSRQTTRAMRRCRVPPCSSACACQEYASWRKRCAWGNSWSGGLRGDGRAREARRACGCGGARWPACPGGCQGGRRSGGGGYQCRGGIELAHRRGPVQPVRYDKFVEARRRHSRAPDVQGGQALPAVIGSQAGKVEPVARGMSGA